MKQTSFFPAPKKEHGGALSVGRKRARRVLATKESLHLTLRSEFAVGARSLLKHKGIIVAVMRKSERLFRVKVYRYAICGNHVHLLIKGRTREELQNFFRVFAGHVAQMILKHCPLSKQENEKLKTTQQGAKKNQRQFWQYLTYTRIISWGREFKTVARYILQNTLEALNILAYQPRHRPKRPRKPPT